MDSVLSVGVPTQEPLNSRSHGFGADSSNPAHLPLFSTCLKLRLGHFQRGHLVRDAKGFGFAGAEQRPEPA